MTLPPPPYARQGGEVIASQLAKVGITAKLQNVEWAQWLGEHLRRPNNYDLTIVSHVEPFDLGNFAKPDYYWGYQSPKFNDLYNKIKNTANAKPTAPSCWARPRRLLADGRVHGFLYQPQWVDRRQQGHQGPVEGHADLRERPGRDVLGLSGLAHVRAVPAGIA